MNWLHALLFITTLTRVATLQKEPQSDPINIVPNPGFEELSILPIGWFYKGDDFTILSKNWSSPTEASPDLYGPKITIPLSWKQKGFGKYPAHSGNYKAGITMYGCDEGKPHCREYLQVNLTEPLVPKQAYHVQFWISSLEQGMNVNNLGLTFSPQRLQVKTDRVLRRKALVCVKDIINTKAPEWQKVEMDFTAERPDKFLIIGNFFPDDSTLCSKESEETYPFAYYYIDDILIHKRAPIIEGEEDEFSDWYPLEENKIIPLKSILFDYDKDIIRMEAKPELKKLVKILNAYPSMEIEIAGHTDFLGKYDYNMSLSNRRAKTVVNFLQEQGISKHRITYIGYGPTRPIASNTIPDGRQKNRRVEFRILKI
jgi:outer membrane protein OmpA-like peptidoglycan-associated protein